MFAFVFEKRGQSHFDLHAENVTLTNNTRRTPRRIDFVFILEYLISTIYEIFLRFHQMRMHTKPNKAPVKLASTSAHSAERWVNTHNWLNSIKTPQLKQNKKEIRKCLDAKSGITRCLPKPQLMASIRLK